jgi:hypothetical protein
MKFFFKQMLKASAFYFEKKKCFISKKKKNLKPLSISKQKTLFTDPIFSERFEEKHIDADDDASLTPPRIDSAQSCFHHITTLHCTRAILQQKSLNQETGLGNWGCLKILNDTKLILNG